MKDRETTISQVEVASAFAALGSEQRLAILEVLVRAGPEGLTTGELGQRSSVEGSTLTHHLKILTSAGLIRQQKEGRRIVCAAVEFDTVEVLSTYLLRNCCLDSECTHNGERPND
ncbi:transcriptional regulator [Chromatiales bacterium (ex Bugula neritina AB1)]|nr:transcriptional regulator [Chromatiales bacterium (ex Bugula neritina AB1)]